MSEDKVATRRDGKRKAFGYLRLSSVEQAEEGWSLGEMRARIEEQADARGFGLLHVFEDLGVSGTVPFAERPRGGELLRRLSEVDAVLFPKLDRLGRDTGALLALFEQLEAAGVEPVSLSEGIDGSTSGDKFTRTLLAAAAQFERDRLSERVREVTRARAREGRPNGGPPPYGYGYERHEETGDPIRGRPWVIDLAESRVVQRIFAEYVGGRSQHAITRGLETDAVPARRGRWHQGTVSLILRNPVYRGAIVFKGEEFPGQHEPIVDGATWSRAAERREHLSRTKSRGRGRRPRGAFLFLDGTFRCGECGEAMVPRTDPNRRGEPYEVYYCHGRKRDPESCSQGPVRRADVDGAVFDYFARVGLDLEATRRQLADALDHKLAEVRALREEAEAEERRADERLARVRRDYADGELAAADWREFREELTAERDAARAEVERLRESEAAVAQGAELRDVEGETLRLLAEVRSRIAGEVRDAEGLEAVRAALLRLFEGFRLHRLAPGVDLGAEVGLQVESGYVLEPEPRPEVVVRFEGAEGAWPVFGPNRVALAGATDGGDGFTT